LFAAREGEQEKFLYHNINALPKAWFVNAVQPLESSESVVLSMNRENFKPDSVAYVVDSVNNNLLNFDAEGEVKLIEYNPNYLEFEIQTNSPQFLVVSEIYYPEGWIAKLDNKEIPIYQVNHILRGVDIQKGSRKLTFKFVPQTYYSSITFLWFGNIIILILIFVPGYFEYKKMKSE
jgi:uncharacterized membrane protein YfhO